MSSKILNEDFFLKGALYVAPRILGAELITSINGKITGGMIVEVEAYLGTRDPASHTFKGLTQRNSAMFKTGGHCYSYFIYGVHHCVNIVTGPEGVGEGVLIRALEPTIGIDIMRKRRRSPDSQLTNGPGKLCEALGIDRSFNGESYLTSSKIYLKTGVKFPTRQICRSSRIGITKAVDHPWRFFVKGNHFVSKFSR